MSNSQQNKQATQQDLARHLGISVMTVSRALRGTGRVSPDTIKKVKAAAEELGYRPNPLVQTLMAGVRTQRTQQDVNLAWVTTHENMEVAKSVVTIRDAIIERAKILGYGIDSFHLNESEMNAEQLRRIFLARGIHGVVIGPLKRPGKLGPFPTESLACSAVGNPPEGSGIHYTMQHHMFTMNQILEELNARGYKRIGLLQSRDKEIRAEYSFSMVFEHVMLSRQLYQENASPYYDSWTPADFKQWVDSYQPDVVVADYAKVIEPLRKAGIRIPEDLGFVATSLHEKYEECSGVVPPLKHLGHAAVDLVVAQLHRNERGISTFAKAVLIEGEWKEGRTLRPR
ncbi:LacI family DNA-binding transcriptional regulator [Kiritimatiellaeota bacterium B1221]|nr:LacI family DNA-binding transcriptional regulator [Kiritimatiellaeota bacterium B1221]